MPHKVKRRRQMRARERSAVAGLPTAEAMAGNVLRLLEDGQLRVRIAEERYKRIQEFTWQRSVYHREAYVEVCLGQEGRVHAGN